MRSISCGFICSFLRGRSSNSSVKKQCVQRMSQTDVTRIFSKTGANGCPVASFAYRFNNSLVVKSINASKKCLSPFTGGDESSLFDARQIVDVCYETARSL